MDKPEIRQRRGTIINVTAALLLAALALFLLWSLSAIILPMLVGALVAYLCIPIVDFVERLGVHRNLSIAMLFAAFFLLMFGAIRGVQSLLPDDQQKLELRIRVQYKLNEDYAGLMGLDDTLHKGNTLYQLIGGEIDPFLDKLNLLLFPDKDQRADLLRSRQGGLNAPVVPDEVFGMYVANTQTLKKRQERAFAELDESGAARPSTSAEAGAAPPAASQGAGGLLTTFGHVVSVWLVTPFVFLFLLLDGGETKRQLIQLVPNRFFEMTLTLIRDVDNAIGSYVRGTLLDCLLVGTVYLVLLLLIGVEPQWALIIGVATGVANAIPFLGPLVGLAAGFTYSLMSDRVRTILPFVNASNLWLWVVLAMLLTRLLDDGVLQPIIVGRAVHLHPLVVVMGVIGGSLLFGIAGTLFAIPAIVVFKVLVTSTLKQLKAYYII